jgi:hypothetical protein
MDEHCCTGSTRDACLVRRAGVVPRAVPVGPGEDCPWYDEPPSLPCHPI